MEFKDNWNKTLKFFRFSNFFKSSSVCQSLQRHLHFIISSLLFSFFLSIPAKGICPVCGGLQLELSYNTKLSVYIDKMIALCQCFP